MKPRLEPSAAFRAFYQRSWLNERNMMTDYSLYVFGADGDFEGLVELDCLSDGEAMRIAFGAESPFGHELWRGDSFLGWFGAGARSLSED